MSIFSPAAPAYVDIHRQRLTFAAIDRLVFTRSGDVGYVHVLRMRIDEEALVRFLAGTIAGGPVDGLCVRPLGYHELELRAEAFGLPLLADLGLGAAGGRVLMTVESARAGWLPISGRLLRDEILASSEPAVTRSGCVRGVGDHALSFDPDYLFSHLSAGFSGELQQRGLPPHLHVRLFQVRLADGAVVVEGGD